MTIITPKTAIEIILSRKAKDSSIRFYTNRAQASAFWSAVICLAATMLLTVARYLGLWYSRGILKLIGTFSTLLVAISVLVYELMLLSSLVRNDLPELKNLEKTASLGLVKSFNDDLDLIHELAQNFELRHLEYAKQSFNLMAMQMRERVGLMVGKLETVGLIPLILTGYVAFQRFIVEVTNNSTQQAAQPGWFRYMDCIVMVVSVFYLFAMRARLTVQWMENVSMIIDRAVVLKTK